MRSSCRALAAAACLAASAAAQSVPLGGTYPFYESAGVDLRHAIHDWFGPATAGGAYAARREIGSVLDQVFTPMLAAPGVIAYHPFLHPEISCFIRSFYLTSLDTMLADMDAAAPRPDGLRVYHASASGVILEAFLPSGPGGALEPFRVGLDISDTNFYLSDLAGSPGCVATAAYDQRVAAVADRLDSLFVTHAHGDHFSLSLNAALAYRQKMIGVTGSMYSAALGVGYPTDNLVAIPPGNYTLNPWVELSVYLGDQVGVQNNVYFFTFDVPVDGSPNDGVTFVHFGDNTNQAGVLAHAQWLASTGFLKPHVLTANFSGVDPQLVALLGARARFQTPAYEFYHFGVFFGLSIPTEAQRNPALRQPLVWGESMHYPADFWFAQ
jgi:hypothetical protein